MATPDDPAGPEQANEVEQCLDLIGFGWCNFRYCASLTMVLIAALLEIIGISMVLPAAKCDLNMSDAQRGIVASIPQLAIFLTSYAHGYFVDTKGRKKMIVFTCMTAGILGLFTALMPEIISFSICKFLTSLCVAVPVAVPYTFIAEILPRTHRDILISVCNAVQIAGSALIPLLAWAIIPLNFRLNVGIYIFRPWRLLSMMYSSSLIIAAVLVNIGPESPKFLIAHGNTDGALKVLQNMYARNKSTSPGDLPVQYLAIPATAKTEKLNIIASLKVHTVPLMQWQYLKYVLLNGMLLFGVYALLNGLYLWVPDLLNRVLSSSQNGRTACQVITSRFEETDKIGKCNDSMDTVTFMVNALAQIICAILGISISLTVKFCSKKILIISLFFTMGTSCIVINFITEDTIFAIILSALPILALAIGNINAYAVEIFPTNFRGMGVCLSMMLGRLGSMFGNTVSGIFINIACELMFYIFAVLMLFCGALTFLHK